MLGCGYVFGAVYLTDQLGFAVFTICMILGQILVSLGAELCLPFHICNAMVVAATAAAIAPPPPPARYPQGRAVP